MGKDLKMSNGWYPSPACLSPHSSYKYIPIAAKDPDLRPPGSVSHPPTPYDVLQFQSLEWISPGSEMNTNVWLHITFKKGSRIDLSAGPPASRCSPLDVVSGLWPVHHPAPTIPGGKTLPSARSFFCPKQSCVCQVTGSSDKCVWIRMEIGIKVGGFHGSVLGWFLLKRYRQ